MENLAWTAKADIHYHSYHLAKKRWGLTGNQFFKKQMNLEALNYRACRNFASQAGTEQRFQQFPVRAAQGH